MHDNIAKTLLAWYDRNRRSLPWRDTVDAYGTWVSEIMLQQTRVETVIGYFGRFMEAFPNVQALAEAPLEDVLKLWEGLGYYSRARNLHKGAQMIVAQYGGIVPRDVVQLRKIPGIGEYTAGAIASIAYQVRTPAVDGNVIRVVSRVCGIRENVGIPSVKRMLTEQAAAMVPEERPGDYNQAVMDLGATVCTPGTPDCEACPLRSVCNAYAEGDAEMLPVLPMKSSPKEYEYDVLLLLSGNRILMRRRTETLLEGLWVYPLLEGHRVPDALIKAACRKLRLQAEHLHLLGEAKHIFTHQIWRMRIYAAQVPEDADAPMGYRFVTLEEMQALTIPTAVAKAKKFAQSLLEEKQA